MQCEKCGMALKSGDESNHLGRIFCEDCYMEVLSPVKTCDPWAVHSAKTFEAQFGGQSTLTGRQHEILAILKETGGVPRDELCARLGGISLSELDRDFAPLRHMEKVRGEKRGEDIFLRLW